MREMTKDKRKEEEEVTPKEMKKNNQTRNQH
jgi:hypothetical protein